MAKTEQNAVKHKKQKSWKTVQNALDIWSSPIYPIWKKDEQYYNIFRISQKQSFSTINMRWNHLEYKNCHGDLKYDFLIDCTE